MTDTVKTDLGRLPVCIVGLKTEEKRNRHMLALCKALGLRGIPVEGVSCDPGFYGCTIGHIRSLFHGPGKNWTELLILENDCGVTTRFAREFEVPADADILYLGNSSCGGIPDLGWRGVRRCALVSRVEGWEAGFRVDNMAATHAILYRNPRAIRAALDSAVRSLYMGRAVDAGFVADLQQGDSLKIYNFQTPLFYQAAELQSTDELGQMMEEVTLRETPRPHATGSRFSYAVMRNGERVEVHLELRKNSAGRQEWRQIST